MKTCRDLLLRNSLRTCFNQTHKNVPKSKHKCSPQWHTFIKLPKEHHKFCVLLRGRNTANDIKLIC